MTKAEADLLDLICVGMSVSDYGLRLSELRNAVLLERLPSAAKQEWQAAYRAAFIARTRLNEVAARYALGDIPLAPWKQEVEAEMTEKAAVA